MRSVAVLALLAAALPAPADGAGEELELVLQLQDAFARVAERALPSVVSITGYAREPAAAAPAPPETGRWRRAGERGFPGYRPVRGGSGFVVSADGYLLTCHHVVVDPENGEAHELLDVELQRGLRLRARLVGAEPNLDLAVLKVEPPHPLQPLPIGDSSAVAVGHWAIALGDPEGAEKTFVPGTIAGLPDRQCYQEQLHSTLLQTSLTLPAESYGGPLVDIRGQVIGINRPRSFARAAVPELAPRGSEYALPIELAMTVYEPIVALESRRSPWLGFSVLPMTRELRARLGDAALVGIYIDAVFEPSPASRAGIRVGDVLARMDGERIRSVQEFQRQLYLTGIGNPTRLELQRAGQRFERSLVVEERPEAARPR